MRNVLAAGAIAVAGAALAQTPAWFADDAGGRVQAKWGIAGSEAVGFEVSCGEEGRVLVRPALFAMAEPTGEVQIRFDVDGDRYDRAATLGFSERDGAWHAGALVAREDPLVDALRRGSTVTYDFLPPLRDGDAFTVSLSGSAKAIDAALEGC